MRCQRAETAHNHDHSDSLGALIDSIAKGTQHPGTCEAIQYLQNNDSFL